MSGFGLAISNDEADFVVFMIESVVLDRSLSEGDRQSGSIRPAILRIAF
jgi:hypothetical protein